MLKPPRRITRRELKEDRLVTVMARAETILRHHQREVMYAVVGAMLAMAAAVYLFQQHGTTEAEAQTIEGRGSTFFTRGNFEAALEQYLAVVDRFPGTGAGARATYMLGCTYFELGNVDEAERYFRRYLDEHGDDDVSAAASLAGIAACLEERGDFVQAGEQYTRAAESYDEVFSAPDYLLSAARCYRLAGQRDLARARCQQVMEEYPDSVFVRDAEDYLAIL